MKKQRKQFILLLLILVLLAGGYYILRNYNENEAGKPIEDTKEYVLQLEKGSIVRIAYTFEGQEYAYILQEDVWKYEGDPTLNIVQYMITNMAARGEGLEMNSKVENVTDFEQYGLKEPDMSVTFETADQSYTFYVGDYNTVTSVAYIREPEVDTVYIVPTTMVSVFKKTLEDTVEEPEEERQTASE